MATITGLTAERMLEIEAQSIVDGDVVAGDLILQRFDGTPINAGSVEGPQGPTGPTGAGVPAGGTTGQILKKNSGTDYDTSWGAGGSPWQTGDTKVSAQTATHADPLGGTWYLADGSAIPGGNAGLVALLGSNFPDGRGRLLALKGTHADVDTIGDSDGVATVANRRPKHSHTHSLTIPVGNAGGGGEVGEIGNHQTTIPVGGTVGVGPMVDQPAYVVAGNLFYHS